MSHKQNCIACQDELDQDNFKNVLTPLGEELQKPCPRCEKPWIIHDCPDLKSNKNPNVAESGCNHKFVFSHQSYANYQKVYYIICEKCGLIKSQINV